MVTEDPVTAILLGEIEILIGGIQIVVERLTAAHFRNADRHGQFHVASWEAHPSLGQMFTQAVTKYLGLDGVHVRH